MKSKIILSFSIITLAIYSLTSLNSCTPNTTTPTPVRDTVYVHDTANIHDTASCMNCFSAMACYPFDGNANDVSGNNFNGTVSNATLGTDRKGNANKAYNFSYSSGSYIQLPTYQSILGSSNDFSVSMWLKFSGVDAGPTPLQLFPDSPSDRLLISVPYHPNVNPADIYWDYGNISSGGRLNIPIVTFTTWKHFVFVRNNALSKLEVFVDGVSVGSKTSASNLTNKNRNFRIGGGGVGTETFNGLIDDVKIFNRALTGSEVSTIYNTEK